MDMPDKIWAYSWKRAKQSYLSQGWHNKPLKGDETPYTRTDLAQSLADALEDLINDEGRDFIKSSSWDAARAALANYRKGE